MPEVLHTRGDTFEVIGRARSLTEGASGDFTGWTGKSQVRDFRNDSVVLSELEFSWIDASVGTFRTIVLDTHNWPHDAYVLHDVQLTGPDGRIRSSKATKIMVERDATRPD